MYIKSNFPASQILILGLSIYAATLIYGNILTILKENKALLINSACMCIFNLICSISYVLYLGANIESVALGTATSYIFCTLIIIYQVRKYTNCKVLPLINSSVIPVCISMIPGILSYILIDNKILGFIVAIIFVVLFYGIFYRKQLFSVRSEL